MQSLYSEESLHSVNRPLRRRFILLGAVTAALLAVFVWAMITRTEWAAMVALSLAGVFAAFFTKSVPLTLLFCIMLPLFASFVATFLQPALMSAPEIVRDLVMALPSYQSIVLTVGAEDWMLFAIALGADAVLALLFTGLGLLRFRRTDLN